MDKEGAKTEAELTEDFDDVLEFTDETEESAEPQFISAERPKAVKISEVFDVIENSNFIPGTVDRIIIDTPGIEGGTHTRIKESLSTGGKVIVSRRYVDAYRDVMELYYGKGKKHRVGIVYTKN